MPQRLGVDSYSLRSQGWDAFQLLDYAAALGLDNVHFSERHDLEPLTPEHLGRIKRRADELGLALEVGFGSFDRFSASFRAHLGSGEEQLAAMIEAAVVCHSPVVRCFLGDQRDRQGDVPIQTHLEECLRTLRAIAPLARERGVKVAVENHGRVDLLAREVRWLIEAAGPDYVGACLDTGNPTHGGEDPVVTAEILTEYAISTHVRDTRVWETDDGAAAQWVPLGDGNVDLPRVLAILAERAPDCPIDLETITGAPPWPVPYLRPDAEFWRMYPDVPGRDLARFVALAKDGTRRGLGPREQLEMPATLREPPADLLEPLREQQRRDFETSVRYAQDVLRLGLRRR